MREGDRVLTVGEVSRATGVSVRTLRRYDAIGLVSSLERTASGHRRYSALEVRRVQRVAVLRAVGISLAEIGEVIDGDATLLGALVRVRRRDIDTRLAELELTRRRLRGAESAHVDDLLAALEDIVAGTTFTREQLARLKARHDQAPLGAWIERARGLDTHVRSLLDQGTPRSSADAHAAAREWDDLLVELTGGEADIGDAIVAKLDRRGAVVATHGALSEESWAFLRAVDAGNESS